MHTQSPFGHGNEFSMPKHANISYVHSRNAGILCNRSANGGLKPTLLEIYSAGSVLNSSHSVHIDNVFVTYMCSEVSRIGKLRCPEKLRGESPSHLRGHPDFRCGEHIFQYHKKALAPRLHFVTQRELKSPLSSAHSCINGGMWSPLKPYT
jgi:hypothetical protein